MHNVRSGSLHRQGLEAPNLQILEHGLFTEAKPLPTRDVIIKSVLIDVFLLTTGFSVIMSLMGFPGKHIPILLVLNLVIGMICAQQSDYYNPAASRHSLGKAAFIASILFVVNLIVFPLLGASFHVWGAAVLFGFLAVKAILSAFWHYESGTLYRMNQSSTIFYSIEKVIKRGFDLFWVSGGLICLSPLLATVALLLWLEGKGSPLFCQTRIGLGEQPFKMYKFRSMVKNAELMTRSNNTVLFKRQDDPRVTPIGRIIRKWSIDELPQLLNVITGDMSLVGPRPPIIAEHQLMNAYHCRKFEAVPGLTGLWQVVGRVKNQRDFNSVAAYDVFYIENWCLIEDLKILFKTVPVVLLHRGAC